MFLLYLVVLLRDFRVCVSLDCFSRQWRDCTGDRQDPSKELLLKDPSKELLSKDPSKELLLKDPSKELLLKDPSKELLLNWVVY